MKSQSKKYTVKPAKDLTSKYDAYMHQRHLNKIQADKNRLQEEENKRIAVNLFKKKKANFIQEIFNLGN